MVVVGALSLVAGSPSVVDSPTPCLCFDALPSSNLMISKSVGEMSAGRSLTGSKRVGEMIMSAGRSLTGRKRVGGLAFSSTFVNSGKHYLCGVMNRRCSSRKQRKTIGLVIVSELGGQYEDGFQDVKTQILNYFTYKAVRTVMHQLYEMNPPDYRWLYEFVVTHKPGGDGKRFIRRLGKEKQDLAERVMVTRLHLYGKWVKKCDHGKIYQEISDENLELMRERLMETVIWPSDDSNTETKIG